MPYDFNIYHNQVTPSIPDYDTITVLEPKDLNGYATETYAQGLPFLSLDGGSLSGDLFFSTAGGAAKKIILNTTNNIPVSIQGGVTFTGVSGDETGLVVPGLLVTDGRIDITPDLIFKRAELRIKGSGSQFNILNINTFDFYMRINPDTSFMIGRNTVALSAGAVACGVSTSATNTGAFASGVTVFASGSASHAEGANTIASGIGSHAEGINTTASGSNSHAEGRGTTASGANSHAEGINTTASGTNSHAEGINTIALGTSSHAEGVGCQATGDSSHAEGNITRASGANSSHAEGYNTTASGQASHAEGSNAIASGQASHAEGNTTTASGQASHAEGLNTAASGQASHAEGTNTIASGNSSHAEGQATIAFGINSHAAGTRATAQQNYTYAWSDGNLGTLTRNVSTTRTGQYMVSASGGMFIPGGVGIGTDNNSNALTVVGQISATSTVFSSGAPVVVSTSTLETPTTGISAINNIVALSQATYNALTIKLPTTLYVIV